MRKKGIMADRENVESTAVGEEVPDRHRAREQAPPSLFAWIGTLVTVLLLVTGLFLERGENPILRVAGVALLALAAVFIFAPFFLLSKYGAGKKGKSYMQTGTVVERGLYRIVRHPQYLGYMLLACGFALLWQRWPAALLALVSVASFYVQANLEERACLARFGEPYGQYMWRIPRFNVVLGIVRLLRRRGK
jgi:protein-S-isoprenylcysteine O-methyltransferase Ste14